MEEETPQSLVFTTCRFNTSGQVLAWDFHLNRLQKFAKKARCPTPDVQLLTEVLHASIQEYGGKEGLARLEWTTEGKVNCVTREIQKLHSRDSS